MSERRATMSGWNARLFPLQLPSASPTVSIAAISRTRALTATFEAIRMVETPVTGASSASLGRNGGHVHRRSRGRDDAGQIKTGSLSRSDRVAKYNQLVGAGRWPSSPGTPRRATLVARVQRAIIVRGRLSGRSRIDLDEPADELTGEVEVVVLPIERTEATPKQDIFDFLRSLPPGTRSKEDIDRQIAEERDSWGDR
jgi:hypothetical protein